MSVDTTHVISWSPVDFREAIAIFKCGDTYYSSWSENDARDPEYCVKYATGPSVKGPWTERAVLISPNPHEGLVATGHHSIVRVDGGDGDNDGSDTHSADEHWVVAYHTCHSRYGSGFRCEIVFAPLEFDDDGFIVPVVRKREHYAYALE